MKVLARSIAALTLASLTSVVALADTLEVSGSTTVQKRIFENVSPNLKKATGLDIKFLPVGSGPGLMALVGGKVPVSASSESLDDTILSATRSAKESGDSFVAPNNLVYHEIARDSLTVIVNKDNPMKSLTKEQLKDLNTGKIKNWKELGGPDWPVAVVTSDVGSATRAVFQKQIMDGAPFVVGVAEMLNTEAEISQVSKEKGGIGALSDSFIAAHPGVVKTVQAPQAVRPLGLITVGQPKPEVQKLINYLHSDEGMKVVSMSGVQK